MIPPDVYITVFRKEGLPFPNELFLMLTNGYLGNSFSLVLRSRTK